METNREPGKDCMHMRQQTELTCRNSGSMKLEFESKSACRIMVDLLSDDADHTVDTIQKRQVELLFFQCKICHC